MTGGITSAVLTTPDGRKHDVSALLEREQLSLDVGGDPPDSAVVKIGGSIPISRDLPNALVVSVAFVDKVDEHLNITATERVHAAKVI